MQDDVVALFAYDRWANNRVLDACRKLTAEQYVAEPVPGWSSVRSTISHIALARRPALSRPMRPDGLRRGDVVAGRQVRHAGQLEQVGHLGAGSQKVVAAAHAEGLHRDWREAA